jgi:hypothetical protein
MDEFHLTFRTHIETQPSISHFLRATFPPGQDSAQADGVTGGLDDELFSRLINVFLQLLPRNLGVCRVEKGKFSHRHQVFPFKAHSRRVCSRQRLNHQLMEAVALNNQNA